jgi:hypothetical protein
VGKPVLFIIYNRPDLASLVFEEIRRIRPKELFVFADGPKESIPGDYELCRITRKVIDNIDWECNLQTLFSDRNNGCRVAVSSAIDWFFDNVNEGIILEDDCVPSQSFFKFCEQLLDYYKDDTRIMQICGTKVVDSYHQDGCSYYFSKYGPIWGWATWKRSWKYYDVNIKTWNEFEKAIRIYDFGFNKGEDIVRKAMFNTIVAGEIDTWDYQWAYAKIINSGLSIVPSFNLVTNIGYRNDATHTKNINELANRERYELQMPLIHPMFVARNKQADNVFFNKYLKKTLFSNIVAFVKRVIA